MSKHHHQEGQGSGGRLRHNWFFYVSGVFLLLALIGFILANTVRVTPAATSAPPPAPAAAGK